MGIEEKRAIVERLDRLKEEISFLEQERPSTVEILVADDKLRRSLERSLEVALEAVLDIARLIINLNNLSRPADNTEMFDILGQKGFLPSKFVQEIRGMAGMRNVLVHHYTGIDFKKLFAALHRTEDLKKFANYIAKDL